MDTLGAALCVFIAGYVTATTQRTTTRTASRSLEPSELNISFGDRDLTSRFTVLLARMINTICVASGVSDTLLHGAVSSCNADVILVPTRPLPDRPDRPHLVQTSATTAGYAPCLHSHRLHLFFLRSTASTSTGHGIWTSTTIPPRLPRPPNGPTVGPPVGPPAAIQ